MARSDRLVVGPAGSAPALAPPWAAPVAVAALLVGTFLAGLVWHATRLDPVDASVMRWQQLVHSQASGVAAIVSGTLPPVMLMTMVAGAALAWLAGRRDAVVLALAAAPQPWRPRCGSRSSCTASGTATRRCCSPRARPRWPPRRP